MGTLVLFVFSFIIFGIGRKCYSVGGQRVADSVGDDAFYVYRSAKFIRGRQQRKRICVIPRKNVADFVTFNAYKLSDIHPHIHIFIFIPIVPRISVRLHASCNLDCEIDPVAAFGNSRFRCLGKYQRIICDGSTHVKSYSFGLIHHTGKDCGNLASFYVVKRLAVVFFVRALNYSRTVQLVNTVGIIRRHRNVGYRL